MSDPPLIEDDGGASVTASSGEATNADGGPSISFTTSGGDVVTLNGDDLLVYLSILQTILWFVLIYIEVRD